MAKATAGSAPQSRARLWRVVVIAAIVLLAALLVVGLVGFFADPLHLPPEVLSVLDQRASVLSMFIGAAGLAVAVAALLLQLRAERAHSAAKPGLPDTASETPPQVSASGEHSIAVGGDNTGIASNGDQAHNVQMRAQASGQGRVYQSGGDQRRSYGGDHIEVHHNTFHDKVIGKKVTGPQPSAEGNASLDGDGDERG